jgi:putative ubiquitin-RnfH superfamily antitoxin RatB of RatAB toxin-antitoxin module
MDDLIRVEVAYGTAERQVLLEVEVPVGTTVLDAIERSGILDQFPDFDIDTARLGIFSESVDPEATLSEHDRVEIYRPLLIDPKEARRRRAKPA